jgi:hypothetical protein
MNGNILRVDPGMERYTLETALLSQKRHVEKRLTTPGVHGDAHARLLEERDALKRLLERVNER